MVDTMVLEAIVERRGSSSLPWGTIQNIMREHSINSQYDFIQGYYFDDLSICDKLIDYHKNGEQKPGVIGTEKIVDPERKDSTDVILTNGSEADVYMQHLAGVTDQYCNKYNYAGLKPFTLVEWIQIQHYKPGQGYHKWHFERVGAQLPGGSRHLVFMTYLNTVVDGGETEFFYQKLKIKPEKGLTLIWPADWTFTHRGCTSLTEEKYITTGWLNYIQ